MNGRYEQAVIERLSDRFGGAENGGLAAVLMETAKNAVEDNLQDYTCLLYTSFPKARPPRLSGKRLQTAASTMY